MRSRRHSRAPEVDPFYDMLFNMLIAFVFCFIVALLVMNPKALKAGDIPSKAEFILNVSWPDLTNDVIKVNPSAEVVFYGQTTLAHKGDEATPARFNVLPEGGVAKVNTLPKRLVQRL